MDIMIVARPTQPFTIMVTEQTEKYDAEEVTRLNCTLKDLEKTVDKLTRNFSTTSVSLYGPTEYIKGIAKRLPFEDVELVGID